MRGANGSVATLGGQRRPDNGYVDLAQALRIVRKAPADLESEIRGVEACVLCPGREDRELTGTEGAGEHVEWRVLRIRAICFDRERTRASFEADALV